MSVPAKKRCVPPELVPKGLWTSSKLRLPEAVYTVFAAVRTGLSTTRSDGSVAGAIGGRSTRDAEQHFVDRFENSAGRITYVALDPTDSFSPLADYLQQSVSDGNVAVLDAVCGSGAASAALVLLMCKLRSERVVPALPLNLRILGADNSPRALQLFDAVMCRVAEVAPSYGIHVTWKTREWDATNIPDTARLCDDLLLYADESDEFLVLISNISGEATKDASKFFTPFSRSLEDICARLHDQPYTVCWTEPCQRSVKKKLFPRLKKLFSEVVSWLGYQWRDAEDLPCAEFELWTLCRRGYCRSSVTAARIALD